LEIPTFDSYQVFALTVAFFSALQLITALFILIVLYRAAKERQEVNRNTFGLLKKIEGLVARKQEKLLEEYDSVLEDLQREIPKAISKKAGLAIYEAERKILTRLAELEPDLKNDKTAINKMNELIKNMEALEASVIHIASEVVKEELLSKRKDIFSDKDNSLERKVI
jgi:hypothetical protein